MNNTPTGASQPIQLDENNNFIDPVTGEWMHKLTVEEMPHHTFGAELYTPEKNNHSKSYRINRIVKTANMPPKALGGTQ